VASCRSCNAEIEWFTWADSGRAVPLDARPAPADAKNALAVIGGGKVRRYTVEDARLGRDRRIPHFATCPDAKDWRNR
jgi:hypothetical protein